MTSHLRPYLILPLLIEQPTWGGDYILTMKNWQDLPGAAGRKIGQSYELFGKTKLMTQITDSTDPRFHPEFGNADGTPIPGAGYTEGDDFIPLQSLIPDMPLLIKFTQAAGNSFQLHVKPGTKHDRWLPKPESWYYFEDGYISCGLKKGANVEEYKKTCKEIEQLMKELSGRVASQNLSYDAATSQAKDKIKELNPWQFVNLIQIRKGELIDLSAGGIHHSWEENKEVAPLGNIVYEVQVDVMDPYCTIRSFDQGKIKPDGTIREIHIDDYFQFMDTDEKNNDISTLMRKQDGETLLSTPFYGLDILELSAKTEQNLTHSFDHLFVKEGTIEVACGDGQVIVSKGHSCIIPPGIDSYTITPQQNNAVVLKTYIPSA